MSEAISLAGTEFLQRDDVVKLLNLLNSDGGESRIAGGAVRNALLGREIADIDIATNLLPGEVTRRAEAMGWKVAPTGIAHGTVTVIAGSTPFEVTTLRQDIETDGRHAKVRFGKDFQQDAARRDFTVNAMSAGLDGIVHDYFGGVTDLAARRIRFIGDARQRLREDYLRALRFFRFHAQIGEGPLDSEGFSAVLAEKAGLEGLSRERVRQETLKLIVAPGAATALGAIAQAGLLPWLIGGEANIERFQRLAPLDEAILGLAALAVDTSADAVRLREKLRLSNAEYLRLHALGKALESNDNPPENPARARALHHRLGGQTFGDLAALRAAGEAGNPDGWSVFLMMSRRWKTMVFPLGGEHLLRLGMPPGPGIGETLKRAEAAWIEAGFPDDNQSLDEILRAAAHS